MDLKRRLIEMTKASLAGENTKTYFDDTLRWLENNAEALARHASNLRAIRAQGKTPWQHYVLALVRLITTWVHARLSVPLGVH